MFEGKKVRLRVLEKQDIDEIMKRWNDPELKQFLGGALPHTRQQEEEWFESVNEAIKRKTGFTFGIERIEDKQFIGTLSLHNIDWISRSAIVGIAVYGAKNWGKGYGTEALQLLINFAWHELNLRRLELSVHAFNERAIRTYQKLGFKRFGTAHQKFFIRGRYVDTHFMELFRDAEDTRESND